MAVDPEVVHDCEVLAALESQLEKAQILLRGVCMACSSCYELDTPWVKLYTQFKKDISKEAIVFKKVLLPLTVCILTRIAELFQNYFEKTYDVWKKTLMDVQGCAKEHEQLVLYLHWWYSILSAQTANFGDIGKPVLDQLYIEDRRIKTDEHVISVKSKKGEVGDLFVPLLFVPRFGEVATPFCHGPGAAVRDFNPPPVAKTQEEMAAASTLAMTKTFVTGIRMFTALLAEVSASVGEVRGILERLYKDAVNSEFSEESDLAMRQHFEVVYDRSPRVIIRCSDLHAAQSNFQGYTENVPYDREKYADEWIGRAMAPDGELISEKVEDATTNVEVIGLMDGF